MRFKDVVCPVCGCVCDDLEVLLRGEEVIVYNACSLGESKFKLLRGEERILRPAMRKRGGLVECSYEEAIKKAARILRGATHPLIFLGAETSVEAMRVGIEIAELCGGVADCHPTICHGPTILGLQEVGIPTATLGEIKNFADLVVYWGSNPLDSHPRHMSRYTFMARGYYRKDASKARRLVVVDPRETPTARIADLHIRVEPNYDIELIAALRAWLRGHEAPTEVGGVPREQVERFVEMLKGSKYIAIFLGLGMASSLGKYCNLEQAIKLVRDLNRYTRVVLMPPLGHGNVAGFLEVMTWQSGYPFGVDYSRGYPRYNPGEYTTVDLLREGEVDAALIVAADLACHLPMAAVQQLAKIPVISVLVDHCPTTSLSDVVLPGVLNGIEAEGTIYRMDHVPLRLKKLVDPPLDFTTSDEQTLKDILRELR